jgi:hypothetical protein
MKEDPGTVALSLAASGLEPPQVSLLSGQQLRRATLGERDLKIRKSGQTYELELPSFTKESELILYFLETNR